MISTMGHSTLVLNHAQGMGGAPGTGAAPGAGWPATPNSNFNNKWVNNQNPHTNTRQDWSAFESLLPDQSTNNNKKMADNEMMDLLS